MFYCRPTSLSSLIDRTLIQAAPVLLVLGDGPQGHHGHLRVELLQSAVSDRVHVHIPAGSLKMYKGQDGERRSSSKVGELIQLMTSISVTTDWRLICLNI